MDTVLKPQTIAHLASRTMRQAHWLWHRSRDVWNLLIPEQQHSFIARFGWQPRPSRDARGQPISGHPGPGRDFLYMHRVMIRHVNELQHHHGGHPVHGWEELPAAGDPRYPVAPEPRGLAGKDDAVWKRAVEEFEGRWKRHEFRTISALGSFIEHGLHALMHERFCIQPVLERMEPAVGGAWPVPAARWDVPAYHFLLDPYSAHVNPVFWSIHGWIDSKVDQWEAAHGPVDWQGAWVGPMDHSAHGVQMSPAGEVLVRTARDFSAARRPGLLPGQAGNRE